MLCVAQKYEYMRELRHLLPTVVRRLARLVLPFLRSDFKGCRADSLLFPSSAPEQ